MKEGGQKVKVKITRLSLNLSSIVNVHTTSLNKYTIAKFGASDSQWIQMQLNVFELRLNYVTGTCIMNDPIPHPAKKKKKLFNLPFFSLR